MKYVSIDIETSGLDHNNCQILSFGAVIEDTVNEKPIEELPKLHCVVIHDCIKGEPYALNMNRDIIKMINDFSKFDDFIHFEQTFGAKAVFEDSLAEVFYNFLLLHGFSKNSESKIVINVAGKNVNFDLRFLQKLPKWDNLIRTHQRVIDPSILFVNWREDSVLPNLTTCKERAKLEDVEVKHDALQDALDVVKVLRVQYDKGI